MNKANWKELAVSVGVSLGAGLLAGLISSMGIREYGELAKPFLSPPASLFPKVWTLLYILQGIAAWLVYRSASADKEAALKVYALQLAVNFFWPVIFFVWEIRFAAFLWLLLLIWLIWLTIRRFLPINKAAVGLLLPYLLWCIFAAYLNLASVFLNA